MRKTRKRTSIFWKIPKEDMVLLVKESNSLSEIIRKINLVGTGNSYQTLKSRLDEDKIDYSHIKLGLDNNKGRKFLNKAQPLKEIMVKNSTYSRGQLKRRLIKESILENKCKICGLESEWQGKKLVMVLDHINGVNNDNRLENLRLICPNCNSQTDTFAGRSLKKKYRCPDCYKVINKKSNRCFECSNKHKEINKKSIRYFSSLKKSNYGKVKDKPTKEDLENMISTMSWVDIGKKYEVSDNAVKKWARNYKIEIERRKFPVPEKTCPVCQKIFKTDNKNQICCSVICNNNKQREHFPDKDILINSIKLNGISGSARFFNIHRKTIIKWLLFYNLPINIKEIINNNI